MAELFDDNEQKKKDLYRKMLAEEATAESTRKYSFPKFKERLSGDEVLLDKVSDIAVKKGWSSTKDDFYGTYFPELFTPQAAPAPKPQAAPAQQFPVGIAAPGAIKGAAPSITDIGREMAFEPAVQQPIEPVEPVGVMAPEPAQKPIPSVTEVAREMAFKPPVQPKMPKEKKERGFGEWAGDVAGTIAAGGKRIGEGILSSLEYYVNGTLRAGLPEIEATQSVQDIARNEMFKNAAQSQKQFQDEAAKRNIQTSVLQAIDKEQYKDIPEAVLYTVGDAAMQIIPSILTMGGSTYLQTLPQAYKDGVEAIAKEKGISPEQVIANGDDAMIIATISSGVQSALEFLGAGLVSKSMASRGAYKSMRDWLLRQGVNRNLARGAALLGVGVGEGTTEYLQEGTGQIGVIAAKSPTTKAFFEKLPKELFTPQAKRQREEAFVGGLIGGAGVGGAGQVVQSAMDRTLFEAPKIGKATQRPDASVVMTDDKLIQRNNLNKAMESAIQANPEAEGQIRERYRKLNDALELTDDEVVSAYDGIAQLPDSKEKDAIRERLEQYMAEKGIPAEPTGIKAGLGEGLRATPPAVIQTVNPDFPAPQPPVTEEATVAPLTEEELAQIEETELTPEEEAALLAQEETAPVAPVQVLRPELPEIQVPKPEGFAPSLRKLGYTDEEISKMTLEQQQDIVINKTEPARAAGESKVDVAKENQRVERVAEAQRKIDEEIAAEEAAQAAPEVVSAAPVEEVAPEAPVAPAPKGRKKKEVNSLRGLKFTMRRPTKNKVIFVPVDALLEQHAEDQPSYDITKPENRIKGRVEKAKEFIKNYINDQRAINPRTGERMNTKVSFEPSVVDILDNGKISFEDGRHRVLAAKELGITEVPIEVPRKNANDILKKLNERQPEKEREYEQVQRVGEKAREGKGAPKAERVIRPKAKPVRNAGKSPDAITARNITFYSDPVATSLQYLMDATYHPDLLERIFGGPSKTTKSGRKDISGERRSRIQFLDKASNIKTADKLGEYLAEKYAEENNIDVSDAAEQHDFTAIAEDIVSSYSSRSQMVRELLRLNEQQDEAFEFPYNPEEIYGEGYNEDIAKEIDGILDELPDSYWEGKEITDEEFGNLFAEEAEPETKEGKKPAPKTKQKKYEKGKEEGGLTLNETPGGVPYLSQSGGADYEVPSGLQWEGDRLNGEFLSVIGKWNETNYISFTGDTYVKDASDVAEIMSLLENKSVEHSFAVHVDEDGKGHVQFLNIGVLTETHMNKQAIIAGVKRFKTKKLYLVHNHPSGQLKISDADKAITETIQQILAPLKVIVDHVILNTYKKQYSVYENWGGGKYIEARGIARKEEGGKEKLTTHIFNEQQVLSKPQKSITSPLDAAEFIQQMRLTALPKSAMLLLNTNNEIIGNYFFVKGIDYNEILDIISTSGITRSIVFYGNQNNVAEINKVSSLLKDAYINVLDAITLSSNGESVVRYYESAAEKGVLKEVHEKYGTNSVPSPSPSFTSQQSSEAATAFDKAKTSKGFDKKYGKGAYKALSDITKNFDAIMDKVSDKIKQDCL